MTEIQAHQLDLILKTSIQCEGNIYSIEDISIDILPGLSLDECRVLFHYLNDNYPALLYPASGPNEDMFWANDYAKAFIFKGGFTKFFNDQYKLEQEQAELKRLEKVKLLNDIASFKITKRQYIITTLFAVIGFLLALGSLLWQIFHNPN